MKLILKRVRDQVLGTDRLLRRVTELEDQVQRLQAEVKTLGGSTPPEPREKGDFARPEDPVSDYPVNVYNEGVPWEIPVQLCLKDFIRHGDCVLDVGANIGGVAIAMSRLVGESGQVHAFEANPALLPRIAADLAANGVRNVTVVGKAVWCTSGERRELQIDDSYYACASSLISAPPTSRRIAVETVTVDDYCRRHQLAPRAIKLDVEAAEYFVLRGAERTIRQQWPVIVFEYCAARPGEDPAGFLQSLGYVLYDTNTYQRVDRATYLANYGPNPTSNVLAVPPTMASAWSVSVSPPTKLEVETAGLRTKAFPLQEAGRYIFTVSLEGPESQTAQLMLNSVEGRRLAYYEAPIPRLKQHDCSNLVFEVDGPTMVICGVEGHDLEGVVLEGAKIARVRTCLAQHAELLRDTSEPQTLRKAG